MEIIFPMRLSWGIGMEGSERSIMSSTQLHFFVFEIRSRTRFSESDDMIERIW